MAVVGLNGAPVEVVNGRVPSDKIVTRMRTLLEQAQKGEITAIAVALVRPGGTTSTMFEVGNEPISHELMACITYLQHRYASHKLETSEDAEP